MRPHSGNSIENYNPIIVNAVGKNCDPIQRHLFISLLLGSTPRLKKLQASEMKCFRKLLGISYRDHITNDAVRDRIRQAIGPYDDILRWLDTVFQGQYLSSLSINYVAKNKVLEKLPPQLY